MALPLDGIRVLDMTVFQQGSYASAMLADMGADVIKIEAPDHPDPGRGTLAGVDNGPGELRPYFEHLNRNKRAICLDLKQPAGREVLLRLVETADIFHNNMRPGVLRRLGLTYAAMRARNPRIIVSNATGWGHLGPDAEAELGSMDILAQARGGIMSTTGTPETGALPVGVPFADHVGAITSAYGMMVALWERAQSGEGQEVNTSLYGSQLCIQGFNITAAMWSQRDPGLVPLAERRPHWSSYECADGGLLMLGGGTPDRWWSDFCEVLGCPELGEGNYTRNASDRAWRRDTRARIETIFRTRTRDEWMATLSPRFLVQPVRSYVEIGQDPQAWANGYLVEVPREGAEPLPTVGVPVHLSRTPGSVRHLAPQLGEHTEQVLIEGGYSWDEIAALRDAGAFGEIPVASKANAGG
jgi:crotonobetainyl-CoA:carnitine CoA-transferase CaiB-like acyl-CoA transferase